jgi:hypothetical protein
LLHESEHLRRRDDWTNLLQKLSLVLFPLNPALAWIERRLCREREMACDEGVVRRTQAPRSYAACLATLAEHGLQRRLQALSLGAFERRPELASRVRSILRHRPALHPAASRALMGAVACGLLVASVELARCPQVVGFVTPAPRAQVGSLGPAQPGAATAERASTSPSGAPAMAGVRAIEAKAILPARRNNMAPQALNAPHQAADHPAAPAETEIAVREANEGTPRAQFVKAVVPDPVQAQPQGQEYIVVAAWEQVEATSSRSRAVADYDNDGAAQAQAGATAGETAPAQSAPVTVTRLILLVYTVNSAPNSKTSRTPGSHSNRPAAPAVDIGRLAFQL